MGQRYFHLHLISDATGETLVAASRAVASQFPDTRAITHLHAMTRSARQFGRVLAAIEREPGIVLTTLTDAAQGAELEAHCREMGLPCVSLLTPLMQTFRTYLGACEARRPGAQHELDADYFARIDALNYTMLHDDGTMPDDVESADVVLVGVSRTSKTPTSLYLANRGVRTSNMPLVPGVEPPSALLGARRPLVVGLIAAGGRLRELRQHRILGGPDSAPDRIYTDGAAIADEIAHARRICQRQGWPTIDVTRRSIEETAAAILALLADHRAALSAAGETGRRLAGVAG